MDKKILSTAIDSMNHILNHIEELIVKYKDSNMDVFEAVTYIQASRTSLNGFTDIATKSKSCKMNNALEEKGMYIAANLSTDCDRAVRMTRSQFRAIQWFIDELCLEEIADIASIADYNCDDLTDKEEN